MTRERIASLPADDWRRRSSAFTEPNLSRNLAIVDGLREIAKDTGAATVGEVAIAWTLQNPAVTAAIVGARNAEQVDGWIGAATLKVDPSNYAVV
jgi:aryl-alcohol dehydrogenase-like predicted oxidoreductase